MQYSEYLEAKFDGDIGFLERCSESIGREFSIEK